MRALNSTLDPEGGESSKQLYRPKTQGVNFTQAVIRPSPRHTCTPMVFPKQHTGAAGLGSISHQH